MAQARKAQVIITANASVAEKVMQELEGAATRASNRMKALADAGAQIKERMRQLAAANKQNTDEYKQLDAQLKQNNKDFKAAEKEFQAFNSRMRENVKDTKRVEQVMKDLANTATRDLRRALQAAKRELDKMSANDPRRTKMISDMRKLQAQIDANTGSLKKQQSAWGSLGTTMKNLFAYAGVFAGFNKIKSLIEGVFQSNLKLSDSLADIRKVSGLAMTDINRLYRNITQIDTRNTIEALNQLAYTGAKLGIGQNYGVEGLTGFVKAAEQVQMALGEDMGEKALPELAKMTEVMGLIDKYGVEQAMQKAASAIFQLGATSTATGSNIVEFSKRLYGLANVTRVSTDDLLALGSAADAMGLMPEVAATAFNKLFTSVQKNHNMIEKTLGLQQGLIKSYYDQGRTMEAIVAIFEKMNQTGNLNLLGGVFKDLGSDGARLVNVMATMADRVDILKKHLETSRTAFKEGEAVIGEYMIQNQTAAAMVERASNLWAKAFTNPEGVTMVQTLAKEWYELSKEMTSSQSTMLSLKSAIEGVALALRTIISLAPFLIKAFAWGGILAMIRGVGFGLYGLITQLRAATGAAMTLQVALKSNWVLAGVSAVAAAMTMLYEKSQAAAQAAEAARERQAELDKAFASSKEAVQNVVKPLATYKRVLDDANLSEKQKMDLVKDFNSTYSEYLDFLGIEVKSVDDLRDAYARVVEVMRIKKAYEERESYRTQVNGTNRMDRIGAQAQAESEARSLGVEDINKEYLEGTQNIHRNGHVVRQGSDKVVLDILRKRYGNNVGMSASGQVYRIETIDKSQPVSANNQRVVNIDVDVSGLRSAVSKYVSSYRTEKQTDQEVDQKFDSEFSWTDGTGRKRSLSEFNIDEYNQKVMEGRYKRKGSLDREAPDKDAARAAKKAEADHKQAIRKDLQDAKQESDAIIAKIEEWYRLQETVVTGFAADGKWTQQQAEMVNRELEAAKNEALANARLAISGRDTQTWEQTKESLRVMMFDTGEWSQELFQQMMDVSMASIRQNLSRIDKEGGQYGITTSSLKDGLDKNAAGNRRKVQELRNKTAKEVEKMLLKYDFLEQAIKAFDDRLTSLGLLTESAEAAARRIQAGGQSEEQVQQQRNEGLRGAASKFIREGAKNLTVNYESGEDLAKWIGDFSRDESWADAFKEDFDKWRSDSKKYKGEMQAFFLSLVQMSDDYTEATKKAYEREKKLQDQRFQLAGYKTAEERTDTSLELREKMQDAMGSGQNFWQQNGLQDTITTDPEVQRIQNRIYYRNLEYEDAKAHLDRMLALQQEELQAAKDSGASEQQLAEMQEQQRQARADIEELTYQRQTELLTATADLAAKVTQEIASRTQTIQELSQPISDFAENAGQKLGDMMFNMESQSMTWNQIWKNMVLALAQSTVKMGAQWLTQKIQQALFYKQMEADEATHQAIMTMIAIGGATARMEGEATINATGLATNAATNSAKVGQEVSMATILTMLGISEGAAKIIGTLGWWGIPLIAVISSLLLGLLASALSTAGQESGGASAAAKPKIKLAQGMLTYDSGNVQTVVGDDGRVYRAREQQSLPEGVSMVTEPIATRVNGQHALVGERGPEIVIGRRTTRAIQMNRPDLLRDLAMIDRGITTRKVRTFDEGNISELASAIRPDGEALSLQQTAGGDAGAERQALIERLNRSDQLMQQVLFYLQNPVAPEIAMYDSGGKKGLRSKIKEADKFMSQYGG